ncbi:MAG: hypothetical protein COY69_00415 [Candidatus Magasanikbacteria bacterium CG_4_10_14_0_8_um_filter_32_14]|uniref:DNA 3'-5' helicase n=2 Tax=Candidatus Magasanikiibacteriota TaxID=1752731 RepID=A0A2M7RAT3_9BACT|nr:MAG: hypothetical protein AUJ23_01830 [Candidatus Magasanikbacteria bacterium CG1_02_32_51]PIY93671.1 MAG: hypothetical protein COY69_00415 [Candidatus Magasanikbacteria bacterium CG_4_10_14_0_8_um_filter_32_14]
MSKQLNKIQKEAVEYNDGNLLIIAGAGTGKTTVITEKIAYIVEKKLALPEEILALTFTDKAAEEMQDRVDSLIETPYTEMQISTFHSFCQKVLEEYGLEIGLPTNFRLLTETDAWLLLREHIYEFAFDYYRPMGSPNRYIHELLTHFSKAKDELITPQNYLDYVEGLILDKDDAERQEKNRLIELADAYHKYQKLLLDNEALDFGDIIFYAVKLLQDRPNILKKLQKRFHYIMVDEFQDVNWAQYQLIKLLAGQENKLTVVGDDDQAIYSFRGSNVAIIMNFKTDYPEAKNIVLTDNYRSGQEILDLAYKSIKNNNPHRLEEKIKISKRLKSNLKDLHAEIDHLHYETIDEEVVGVINKIVEIKEIDKDCNWNDFAILVRANSHVEPFSNALESFGIPFEYLASAGLYRQDIVIDSFNFLTLLTDIYDDKAFFRLLKMPFLEFSQNDLQKVTSTAKRKSTPYYEILKRSREFFLSDKAVIVADKLLSACHEGIKQSKFEKPTTILYQFMESIGYLSYLTTEENKGNKNVIRQIYHLKQFFDLIRTYEENVPGSHVAGFVENYEFIIESGDGGKINQIKDTPDSVNIITVHGSKGLEYKNVFIVNMVEERFPTRRKSEGIPLPDELIREKFLESNDLHYQEERRLFYVAVTRAKQRLFLTSANSYGGTRAKKISRFLAELNFDNKEKSLGEKEQTLMQEIRKLNIQVDLNSEEIEYIPPKVFSYSRISTYQKCPYQYKLAYVLNLPSKGSPHFSFGNTIHGTLQAFYEKVQDLNSATQISLFETKTVEKKKDDKIKVPSQEELLALYKTKWIGDWYRNKNQREEYFAKGEELLKEFYKSQKDNWTIPVSLEGGFKIKIGEYFVKGRIDRIDQMKDNKLEIIDYKTGQPKDKLTIDDKQQLLIYQIAVETLPQYQNLGKIEKLTFFYLNENKLMSFVGTDKDKEKLEAKLFDAMEHIQKGDFKATPNKHICQYCDFKEICEFRQL